MIKLSDYLSYLNSEVTHARKKADEESIRVAKEYAKHEYLRYFSVPRFSMPSVKLNIPIKITELNSETKYKLKINEELFLKSANLKIKKINKEKKLDIKPINKDSLSAGEFLESITKLKNNNHHSIENIENDLHEMNFIPRPSLVARISDSHVLARLKMEEEETNKIMKNAIKNSFSIASTNLKDIFIDPNTAKETDKDKILLTLDVEMIEEGIRINKVRDKNGNIVEEVVFE